MQRAERGVRELKEHRGETFARWRQAMAACVGGALLDELRDEG